MKSSLKEPINHPCYNPQQAKKIGRLHLPVASKCNMQCNYCNRNYDCPNENRPGVCTKLIAVSEVKNYIEQSLQEHPEITIAGIAGPAEPMADLDLFYNVYSTIKKYFPQLKLCLATNGLLLADNIKLVKELEINFITVTINSLNIKTIQQIYQWVEYRNTKYNEDEAAKILLEKHVKALESLNKFNIQHKINSVYIPDLNYRDIIELAQYLQSLKTSFLNIIPLKPVQGSKFFAKKNNNTHDIENLRRLCSQYINILQHCRLCRSDAKGFV